MSVRAIGDLTLHDLTRCAMCWRLILIPPFLRGYTVALGCVWGLLRFVGKGGRARSWSEWTAHRVGYREPDCSCLDNLGQNMLE